jgi:FSR family fosmidomycin resistance protein-like MFS transporter
LRSFVSYSFTTFVPVLYSREGASLVSVGWMVSLFSMGGAISGLFGGFLADRVGYKPVFCLSFALAVPALYLLLFVPDGVLVFAFLTGWFMMAPLPLFVVMAQELAPRGKSMAASLMQGLAYGIGGMMTPLTGKLADLYGIRSVLSVVALVPIVMMGLVYLLPGRDTKAKL